MATTTPNFGLIKPAVNDPIDEDLWGGYLNTSLDLIDDKVAGRKGTGGTTAATSNIVSFEADGTPVAGNLYGVRVAKSGTEDLYLGINKNTVTGAVPANAAYISTFQSGGQIAIGRGNGAGNLNTADLIVGSTAILGVPLRYSSEFTIASAATTNLATSTSNLVLVTGTTTITSFGTVAAGAIFKVRFSGALTLTHNATSLILPGGANITTAANDTMEIQSLGSGNWLVNRYQRASGLAVIGGGVVQTAYNENNSYTSLTNPIPWDDTIPQNTEGTEVLSASITPRSASNVIIITAVVYIGDVTGGRPASALFVSGSSDAIAVASGGIGPNGIETLTINYRLSAGSTAARTYSVRAGDLSGSPAINGGNGSRRYGGAMKCTLSILEVLP